MYFDTLLVFYTFILKFAKICSQAEELARALARERKRAADLELSLRVLWAEKARVRQGGTKDWNPAKGVYVFFESARSRYGMESG